MNEKAKTKEESILQVTEISDIAILRSLRSLDYERLTLYLLTRQLTLFRRRERSRVKSTERSKPILLIFNFRGTSRGC